MNIQQREKRETRKDGRLAVHSIFRTIQGEGPFCGTPCVFVRLAGCNLQCPACDTDYTSKRTFLRPQDILREVAELWCYAGWRPGLVVVTGGEPFRQELRELFNTLTRNGFDVQVESNGTLAPTPWAYTRYASHLRYNETRLGRVYIVCSPKTGKIHSDIFQAACALKYVVRAGNVAPDGLPLSALDHPSNPHPARPPKGWDRPVYVQPLDSKDAEENKAHTSEAVASCLRHGYILQVQTHKIIGVE